jgi:ABC-2 type transport system permease protein
MTATSVPSSPSARLAAEPVPLSRVTAVELRKMFDTRSGFWLMASIVISALIATIAVILFAPDDQLTYATFGKAIAYPMLLILPMIALLSVTSEWSQRSGLTTFTLIPHRGRVISAKAVASISIGVVSMVLALAIGALGNVVGTAITGTSAVWDVSLAESSYIVLGNLLGLMSGFMLGVLIRSSPGAIVGYFVYTFGLTPLFILLANSQAWFHDSRAWIDVNFAQAPLFMFDGALTGEQWANIGVTGIFWLLVPLAAGLRLVLRSEVT